MPGDLDIVAQEGIAADDDEGDSTGEARCVRSSFTPTPSIDIASHSSQGIELTDEQTEILLRHVAAFQAADPESRSKIIQVSVDNLKKCW